MKRKIPIFIIIAVLIAVTLTTLTASAIVLAVNTDNGDEVYSGKDLTEEATQVTASTNGALAGFATDGNVNTFWQGERRGSYLQFYFKDGIEFNTVVINETGMSVSAFEIYVSDNGVHYDKIYEQDRIQSGRFCAMREQIKAKYVSIRIKDSDASPRINDIAIYNLGKAGEGFEINARRDIGEALELIHAWQIEGITPTDEDLFDLFDGAKYVMCDTVTLQARAEWKKDGTFGVDSYIADNAVSEAFTLDNLTLALKYFKSVTDADVMLSICAEQGLCGATDFQALGNALKQYLQTNGLSGIEIDCTRAHGKDECLYYADALRELKKALGDGYTLAAAIRVDQTEYFCDSAKSVDYVNLVGFARLDQNGDSAAFYASCVQAVNICLANGFDAKQINLGTPLYGTYSGDAGETYAYNSIKGEYGWSDNVFECAWREETVDDIRFNGKQLLYDKASYAVYRGLRGITLFGLECDFKGDGEDTLSYAAVKAISDAEGRV